MYQTILVHVDGSARSAQRIDAAARLALTYDAHLIGLACCALPADAPHLEADRALDAFDAQARQAGLRSFERRLADADAALALAREARYADLVVISQSGAGHTDPGLHTDFPESVIMEAARPVLLVPSAGWPGPIGSNVTVAWNGSVHAMRAITSALALLRRAARVDLLVAGSDAAPDSQDQPPGNAMALYLARHGVRVDVCVQRAPRDPGAGLLAFASASHADLIVMGAYGHSRLREFLFDGATEAVLRAAALPLWMVH